VGQVSDLPFSGTNDFYQRLLGQALGQLKNLQFGHREMLSILGHQNKFMGDGDGSDGHGGESESMTLLPPLAVQIPGELRGFPCHWVEFEATEEPPGLDLLAGPHSHVDLGDVNGTTGGKDVLLRKLGDKLGPSIAIIENVEQDVRIQQIGRLPSRRRSSSSNRWLSL
jgi:hypothetical protein